MVVVAVIILLSWTSIFFGSSAFHNKTLLSSSTTSAAAASPLTAWVFLVLLLLQQLELKNTAAAVTTSTTTIPTTTTATIIRGCCVTGRAGVVAPRRRSIVAFGVHRGKTSIGARILAQQRNHQQPVLLGPVVSCFPNNKQLRHLQLSSSPLHSLSSSSSSLGWWIIQMAPRAGTRLSPKKFMSSSSASNEEDGPPRKQQQRRSSPRQQTKKKKSIPLQPDPPPQEEQDDDEETTTVVATTTRDDDDEPTMASTTTNNSKKRSRTSKDKKIGDATTTVTTASPNAVANVDDNDDTPAATTTSKKPKKPSAPKHQVWTERDVLPKLWNGADNNGSYTFKIASWNVAGLRAVLNKCPTSLRDLVHKHDLDVLCLQETKLQESHITDPKLHLRETIGLGDDYDDYWSCSTSKKGYSGTAIFIKKRGTSADTAAATDGTKPQNNKSSKQTTLTQFMSKKKKDEESTSQSTSTETASATTRQLETALPIDASVLVPKHVSYTMGINKHDTEGRIIMVDYPLFSICNVYVPNSGQNLDRLSYRTEEWDKDFLSYIQQHKQQTNGGVPVIWLGDLNIAHTNYEVWNDGAKHLAKQAGVTAEERASFQQQLDDSGYIDAFRYLHPQAMGHYSYWSLRAGNRITNKGLRLDYFVCDPSLFQQDCTSTVVVRDSYMDFDHEGSDHCPIILELEIKNSA